ncbi:hypothetical protein CRG98_026862 [Punica granatum]|uniref:Uncharacterized protein n=1 Tax=Punica granatum TaxID=22663 RepID=A0A2I0J918_PUNGR|nr:hypothetical protein CRG98_026862 [Punica granatum]
MSSIDLILTSGFQVFALHARPSNNLLFSCIKPSSTMDPSPFTYYVIALIELPLGLSSISIVEHKRVIMLATIYQIVLKIVVLGLAVIVPMSSIPFGKLASCRFVQLLLMGEHLVLLSQLLFTMVISCVNCSNWALANCAVPDGPASLPPEQSDAPTLELQLCVFVFEGIRVRPHLLQLSLMIVPDLIETPTLHSSFAIKVTQTSRCLMHEGLPHMILIPTLVSMIIWQSAIGAGIRLVSMIVMGSLIRDEHLIIYN